MAKKGGLGKGLDAIFYDNAREDDAGAVELSINDLEPNRTQPRQSFDDGAMTELADSIAQHGVLQPILAAIRSLRVNDAGVLLAWQD